MDTPRLVLDAFLVEPLRVAGISLQPFTLRRWMRLEATGNPLLDFEVPEDVSARLEAVMGAAGILSEPEVGGQTPALGSPISDLPPPADFDYLTEAVLQVIGQGFSTTLRMDFPGETGTPLPADLADLFGTPTRLLAHAVRHLHMTPDAALDTPTCQLFVLIASADALDGKVPVGKNYRNRKCESGDRKGSAAAIPVFSEAQAVESDLGGDQREDNRSQDKNQQD